MSPSDMRAVISLGTNTIRLLVIEKRSSGFAQIEHLQIGTRLGEGLSETGTLAPAAKARTLAAIVEFASAARKHGATLACIATSAMRRASDAGTFAAEIDAAIGVRLAVLDGAAEASASFRGATHGTTSDGARVAVLDIGGGSTECAVGRNAVLEDARSIEIGSVRLTERHAEIAGAHPGAPARAAASRVRYELATTLAPLAELGAVDRLIGVAGTALTIGAIAFASNVNDVSGRTLSREAIGETIDVLLDLPLESRRTLPGMLPQRADVLVAGGLILLESLCILRLEQVILESDDLLLGFLLERA